jgi:hypothetical protein
MIVVCRRLGSSDDRGFAEDQDAEHDDLRPARLEIAVREGHDEPDHDAAHRRPGQVADPAQHRSRERQQPELEAEVEPRLPVVQSHHEPGRARQRASDEERQGHRAVDVDAHQARRLAILCRRAHRLALAGAAHEPAQQDEQRDRDARHDEMLGAQDPAAVRADDDVELGHDRRDRLG